MVRLTLITALAAGLLLGGCSAIPKHLATTRAPIFPAKTQTQIALNELPPPTRPLSVAVYGFTDQTGKFETVETGQTLSRAITQGGTSILVKALQDAGDRKWFTVVERESLKDLLNERQIITEMRARYLGELNVNPKALPALLFAGVLLEGGVISYDTNTLTGGAGASILGIGLNTKYKQDNVTVYLRAVSVKSGEVLTTVTTSKTITSTALSANLFAYVASDKILQSELGYTTNEPSQIALRQAIEKAVYALIMEGADLKLWQFQDQAAAWPQIWRYKQERDGVTSRPTTAGVSKRTNVEKAASSAKSDNKPALTPVVTTRPRT
jgi:curli production assembly/transport component CsgG